MKLKEAILTLGSRQAVHAAKTIAKDEGVDWSEGPCFVFAVIAGDVDRAPANIGGKYDDAKEVIRKWLVKYRAGFEGRASQRVSNPPSTISDPIIEKIIGARLSKLTAKDLNSISYAHRLGMSAENILGLILEEYLAENLTEHGWHCAWGETVKSVDFVHEDGRLLQIKNRSNSENSSSSAIRDGTQIEKWYRIKASRIEYMWDALNKICGTTHLTEPNFVQFVKETLTSNPSCLAVEQDNPWNSD